MSKTCAHLLIAFSHNAASSKNMSLSGTTLIAKEYNGMDTSACTRLPAVGLPDIPKGSEDSAPLVAKGIK